LDRVILASTENPPSLNLSICAWDNSSSNIAIIAGGILALIIIPAVAFVVWKKIQTAKFQSPSKNTKASSTSPAAEQPGSAFVPLPPSTNPAVSAPPMDYDGSTTSFFTCSDNEWPITEAY
jgi:hypothetical protein